MGRAYSVRFAVVRDTGTGTYAVPAGQRAVIKWVVARNVSGSALVVSVDAGGSTVWDRSVPGGDSILEERFMAVCYAGETLALTNGGVGLRSMLCGYLLAA